MTRITRLPYDPRLKTIALCTALLTGLIIGTHTPPVFDMADASSILQTHLP